ncbi:E3 ubiquitin-protein ligase TRIM32-like [Discoglossus pictus]
MNIPLSCLNNLLYCTVCTEKYNETMRRPKLLHCGHTFCMHCLHELVTQALQLKINDNSVIVRCPSCRQATALSAVSGVSLLSDNFAIINFFNYHCDEDPRTYCKKHRDEKIKFFCDQCQRLLCPSCGLQHVSEKLHKVEKTESAAMKYRQQIHLAINVCKKKLIHLDEIIEEAAAEKLKLESLSNSMEHLVTSNNDMEVLSKKQIIKQLRNQTSKLIVPQTLLQNISDSQQRKVNSLEPPGFWCSSDSSEHFYNQDYTTTCNMDEDLFLIL